MMEETEEKAESSPKKRTTWAKKVDFTFTLMGMMIGLANVWRFPYLCYKNGGGAFLIPYFAILLIVVYPLVILESAIGQFTGQSAVRAWSSIVPLMKGIGYCTAILLFYCNIFYPVLLSWALRWLVASFSSTLPWASCDHVWNTENCIGLFSDAAKGLGENSSLSNLSNVNSISSEFSSTNNFSSSVEEFWKIKILGATSGVDNMGSVKPELFFCLVTVWVLCYFAVWKGIGWTSKIIYVTATLPFVMIFIVMIRGLTLDGAAEGVTFYIKPNVTKLLEVEIWADAASQIMFSVGICFGSITTLSSFNVYHHNFQRDCIIVLLANVCTSFMAGFAIFSVLGYMAHTQNTTIDTVVDSGPGLVFVVYPAALSLLPLPQMWSAFFFLTLLFLGFDGQFAYIETEMACVKDMIPFLFRHKWSNEIGVAVGSFISFLIAIPMTTEGGIYVFEIFNVYAMSGWGMCFIALCEFATVAWFYGFDKMCDDMEDMLGRDIIRWWYRLSWQFAGPAIVFFIMIYSLVKYEPLTYDHRYIYPTWANALGMIMAVSTIIVIPISAIHALWTADGDTIYKKYKSAIQAREIYCRRRTTYTAPEIDVGKATEC